MSTNGISLRVKSIDTIRGLIMVIMALDHVRDYFHITAFSADPLDPSTTTPALFFTRWITHFCAPSFMLLSGISAYLSSQNKTTAETSSFLLKRGLWLIIVELTFMTFAFSFDVTFKTIFLAVLWALGTSMLVLGLFVRFFTPKAILISGLMLIFGHNLFDLVKATPGSGLDLFLGIFLKGAGMFVPRGDGGTIAFLYVILPWAGVMMSGYGLGVIYNRTFPEQKRRKLLLQSGLAAIVLFIVLRLVNVYGDQAPWTAQTESIRTFFSFMNASKYPPSLIFTLMTLGPVLILLALTENTNTKLTRFFTVYGKVPFFYFMLHFYLIHVLTMIAVLSSGYTWEQATAPELFFKFRPTDFGYNLGMVYAIWISIVLALYYPCKWFGDYRERNKKWWLSYL
ncbi:DUF1624 domain-containing protein [Dyadobacter fanqingshengii]|uniref:Heparan-alpha-glucosaminide N-acetyltransferase domain-containing protein n=1 Tax=Dyadobacter fanqingshengii TaxID=2906443 RepID=A0A9X1P768_9BACT|nr:heparan-alpha-glucosaminide N-acetyltransferase domain-containing protein [Dyadobacter fanqingshengii]MCF0040006.1 heparan-alpha-glucosaminide N-acetyltransferase domain-containing protein [Dyadobacter fanqingshengii]USJ38242.1 heparan-alpha-glucosaminide N-acetyltransferase domain-containing protein [Dyadobacter fanqingshengii]